MFDQDSTVRTPPDCTTRGAAIYEYNATIEKISDADTVVVSADLGFKVWLYGLRLRLAGISCRELKQPGGPEAKAYLEQLLPAGARVRIRSSKADRDLVGDMSFDRYVARVQLADGRDLADILVAAGYACRWDGRTKPTPYPPWPIPEVP